MSVDIVRTYNEAWAAGDVSAARKLIADDLQFRGPMDSFTNADDMATALTALVQVTTAFIGTRSSPKMLPTVNRPMSPRSTAWIQPRARWNARSGTWCATG
jgi:SnoaL-like domain